MATATFCTLVPHHGYQLVTGNEGDDLTSARVVLACGCKLPLNAMTYGVDQLPDDPPQVEPSPAITDLPPVPVAEAIAAAEVLPPDAEWHEVVAVVTAPDEDQGVPDA